MTPYTYLIGWTDHNMFYYGVRYAKDSNPCELWNTYFTSSKHVKNFAEKYGAPNLIQIRKIFKSAEQARLWETKILKRLHAKDRPDFLNMTDNISISKEAASRGQKNVDYKKVGKSLKYFYETADQEYIQNIKVKRHIGILNKTEEAAKRQSEGIRSYQLKSWSDPDSKERRSLTMRKPKSKIACPHCDKVGGSGIMKRWHFDNCKAIGG